MSEQETRVLSEVEGLVRSSQLLCRMIAIADRAAVAYKEGRLEDCGVALMDYDAMRSENAEVILRPENAD